MTTLLSDLRFAGRTLVKSPGFSLVAVICLSLGIGVNSAIFSIVDTIAIRPLPFNDPDRLLVLGSARATTPDDLAGASYPDLVDWRGALQSYDALMAATGRSFTVLNGGDADRIQGALVSWNLFSSLGIQPVIGRHVRPGEDAPGGAPVVLLSHALWTRRFAADPAIPRPSIQGNG